LVVSPDETGAVGDITAQPRQVEGEYRSEAEICLSRIARPDARKKKEVIAPFFAFEACVRIWLLPTVPDRLREVVDSLFVLA
jgi:hypothetical protein